jgi:hypothetical protein
MLGWVKDAYGGNKTGELKERLLKLRLQPAALSCSKVKLDPVHLQDESGQVREYAAFLKDLGGFDLQIIDSGSADGKYSGSQMKAFGARLNDLGKTAQEFGLNLGYHPPLWHLRRNPRGTQAGVGCNRPALRQADCHGRLRFL